MGSWGPGLQANDTALDYIIEKRLNKIKTMKEAEVELKNIDKHSDSDHRAVLGVADYLLDRGVKLPKESGIISYALEVAYSETDQWREPESRKIALDNFRKRWKGKRVSKIDIEIDNLGLFDRMAIGLTNKQIRANLKKRRSHVKKD